MTNSVPESDSVLELVLVSREAELPGGLNVRRAIPQVRRRMVGPFVFVDQMGPAEFSLGEQATVLPHPHIGLSTVTWLFEGEGLHRDSLGSVQTILPGEVNWMTAGRGIVHSERLRAGATGRVSGVQTWVALPRELEECEPSFEHYDASAVPSWHEEGVTFRLIAGEFLGKRSRVRTSSPLFYVDVSLESDAVLRVPVEYTERAAFVVEGAITLPDAELRSGEMGVLRSGKEMAARASEPTRVLLLGGEPFPEARHIFWNFVSSSKDRLKQAANDWHEQRFPRVPGEAAFIPLPEDGKEPVDYP